MRKYVSLMHPQTRFRCCVMIVLAFVNALLASTWPVLLGNLYTDIADRSVRTLGQCAGALVVFASVYLLSEWLSVGRRVMLDCVIADHEARIREVSIEKLLKMPLACGKGRTKGEKTARLNQGVAGFSQLIRITCNDIAATALTAACTIGQVLFRAPGLVGAAMIGYLVGSIVLSVLQIRSQNGIRERIVDRKNALDGQVCQAVNNLELIREMGAEHYESRRLLPDILAISTAEKRHHLFMGSFDSAKQLVKVVFQAELLVLSIALIREGRMAPGSVITVCLLFQQMMKPVDEVYRFMDETASSLIKARALLEVAAGSSDKVYAIAPRGYEGKADTIVLRDVVVTTPERDRAIAWYEDVVINCLKKVALLGGNGCGKTSLFHCLTRYYPHIRGTITLFGLDQDQYDQKGLTDRVYYTPQTSFFINGTVRDNLLYGLEREVTDDELASALLSVRLAGEGHSCTVIRTDPREALECAVGEMAEELSGGMKQRLSLARAFLRRPRLFAFDEITANLDREAADAVLSNIESYAASIGAGIVYISHDPAVVKRCDEVITLKNRISEEKASEIGELAA